MSYWKNLLLVVLVQTALPYAAGAEPNVPVAIIEDATGAPAGVETFRLLREGDGFSLTQDQGVIVSYLLSCRRENIRGGAVVIGRRQSLVRGGTMSYQVVPCDPTALALTPAEANQSAALAFREPEDPAAGDPVAEEAAFILAARLPVVIAPGLDEIILEDRRNPDHRWRLDGHSGVFMLAEPAAPLEKGGVYRITGGGRSLVFRVSRDATDAPLPLLKRLIRF